MNRQHTKAILLKRIEYGEADRILTIITPTQGKLSLLAKGVRRSKSRLAGGLELFCIIDVSYIDGRSDLKTVVGSQLDQYFGNIIKNVSTTMVAYDFLKLIDKYTQATCEESYFNLLSVGLSSLNDSEVPEKHTQTWFSMHLLMISGHGINLENDLEGKAFSEEKTYDFNYDDMSFYERKAGEYSPNHIKLLRLLTKAGKPSHLLKVQNSNQLIDDVQSLVRMSSRIAQEY